MAELNVDVKLESEHQKRLAELKKQKREIDNEIKTITSSAKMLKDFEKMEEIQNLKDSFTEQLNKHPLGKGKTLKWLVKQEDYFRYAMHSASYNYRATSKEAPWVKKELERNNNIQVLIDDADRFRVNAWVKKDRARRMKRKKGNLQEQLKDVKVKGTTKDRTSTGGIG